MATVTMAHFDILDYVDKSIELGVDERIAKHQARQLEQAIEIAKSSIREEIIAKDLATKKDLESAKNQIIFWVAGIIGLSGIVQHLLN